MVGVPRSGRDCKFSELKSVRKWVKHYSLGWPATGDGRGHSLTRKIDTLAQGNVDVGQQGFLGGGGRVVEVDLEAWRGRQLVAVLREPLGDELVPAFGELVIGTLVSEDRVTPAFQVNDPDRTFGLAFGSNGDGGVVADLCGG